MNKPSFDDEVYVALQALKQTAMRLNAASDTLAAIVGKIEEKLKWLNLGVSAWIDTSGGPDWKIELGYTRIARKWGLAVRRTDGQDEQVWLFNDSPRFMRLDTVHRIPELLVAMNTNADRMTELAVKRSEQMNCILEVFAEIADDAPAKVGA